MVRRFRSFPLVLDARIASGASASRMDDPESESFPANSGPHRSMWARLRVPFLVALLAAFWIALVGWASDAPLGAAFQPSERIRLEGNDFHVVMGAGVESGRRLGINAVGAEHMALQSHALPEAVDAAAFPILRYRWKRFRARSSFRSCSAAPISPRTSTRSRCRPRVRMPVTSIFPTCPTGTDASSRSASRNFRPRNSCRPTSHFVRMRSFRRNSGRRRGAVASARSVPTGRRIGRGR